MNDFLSHAKKPSRQPHNVEGNLLIYLLANLAISQTEVHHHSLVRSPAQPSLSPIIVP